ncbi:MAG TPA: plastocyanin/azurin family copper-binding protein [Gemmatimonadaceae bacterium]|nr:plastocyanin/azurin family copper-binding protein [Gemmatimonadaceae bacterium]
MRFYGLALATSAFILGACAGGDNTADSAPDTTAAAGVAADAAPATDAAAGAVAAAPITGTTHEVKMLGDEKGYRFEPAEITVKQGDGIKFLMVSGGPHNVAFDATTTPEAAKAQLNANIPNKMGDLSSNMVMNPNEEIVVSFGNVPAGTYDYNCTPHLAMGMKGKITVQ